MMRNNSYMIKLTERQLLGGGGGGGEVTERPQKQFIKQIPEDVGVGNYSEMKKLACKEKHWRILQVISNQFQD